MSEEKLGLKEQETGKAEKNFSRGMRADRCIYCGKEGADIVVSGKEGLAHKQCCLKNAREKGGAAFEAGEALAKAFGVPMFITHDEDSLKIWENIPKEKVDFEEINKIAKAADKVVSLIKSHHEVGKHGPNDKLEIKCPLCGGKINYVWIPVKGHTFGQCETEKCFNWRE